MAGYDENEELDEVFDEEELDNAMALTSGLIFTTTACLLVALFVVFVALDKYYEVGPLAG